MIRYVICSRVAKRTAIIAAALQYCVVSCLQPVSTLSVRLCSNTNKPSFVIHIHGTDQQVQYRTSTIIFISFSNPVKEVLRAYSCTRYCFELLGLSVC